MQKIHAKTKCPAINNCKQMSMAVHRAIRLVLISGLSTNCRACDQLSFVKEKKKARPLAESYHMSCAPILQQRPLSLPNSKPATAAAAACYCCCLLLPEC